MRFYKLTPAEVVVIYDELDLPPGKFRMKAGGGHGGHNGLRSINAHIGDGYRRLRIGIGHPGHKDRVAPYVLHDFAKADAAWLDPLLDAIADQCPLLVEGKDSTFANKVHLATQGETERPKPRKGKCRPATGATDTVDRLPPPQPGRRRPPTRRAARLPHSAS